MERGDFIGGGRARRRLDRFKCGWVRPERINV